MINARSGKPLRGYRVWLQFRAPHEKKVQQTNLKTAPDGVVRFQLDDPLPEKIYVSLGIGDAACSGQAEAVPSELQKLGVTNGTGCEPSEAAKHISPKPGEIILFVRPMPLWARILAPLETE